jgi:hypothetical protein
MTHADLCDIAERWLLSAKGCGFAFKELSTLAYEIPDAIGFRDGLSILVECKISRSDFLSDKKKPHRIDSSQGMGTFRYYMCPRGIVMPEDLPPRWGLVYVNEKGQARQVVGPKGNILYGKEYQEFAFEKDIASEFRMLCSALRRVHIRGDLKKIYKMEDTE